MQTASLEANRQHDNVMLLSATGSGKTIAFLLPVLERLKPTINKTWALVIVPSRELALQIETVFKSMGTGLKVTCCYGGHAREVEENNLIQAPSVIIGTPGRLADHIRRGNIRTGTIHTLVLDEFDKSLELGFQEEMAFIIGSLPAIQKRILTSATSSPDLPTFLQFNDGHELNFLSPETTPANRLAIQIVVSAEKDKLETLFHLICQLGNRSMIIFCNHRESVERTSSWLAEKGITNVFYHGALEQQERDAALFKFKSGSSDILVTTDLAARGLDIAHIRYIIHYHLPTSPEAFTHRNGRTARMEASGTAIMILSPEEKLPPYIDGEKEELALTGSTVIPDKPEWTSLFVGAGKKDKVNKVDIVGFFGNKAKLRKEDIGLIEVKDYFSFVAIRKPRAAHVLHLIKEEKIKNKKVKIAVAK